MKSIPFIELLTERQENNSGNNNVAAHIEVKVAL